MTIRVMLADDQALIRAGFKALIDATPDLTVVGEAATGTEALIRARTARADVALMDIRMPDMDGITATREITTNDDMAGVRVIIPHHLRSRRLRHPSDPSGRQRVPR